MKFTRWAYWIDLEIMYTENNTTHDILMLLLMLVIIMM